MNTKQERLILESLFIIMENLLPYSGFTHEDMVKQKSKINDRLVEIQKEEVKTPLT